MLLTLSVFAACAPGDDSSGAVPGAVAANWVTQELTCVLDDTADSEMLAWWTPPIGTVTVSISGCRTATTETSATWGCSALTVNGWAPGQEQAILCHNAEVVYVSSMVLPQ